MKLTRILVAAFCGLIFADLGNADAEGTSGAGYGFSIEGAIEVCMPRGEHAYLTRLVCADGTKASFERVGSVGLRSPFPEDATEEEQLKSMADGMNGVPLGVGEIDHHMIDAYSVKCGSRTVTLYLDMYHCASDVPDCAPEGFTLNH